MGVVVSEFSAVGPLTLEPAGTSVGLVTCDLSDDGQYIFEYVFESESILRPVKIP